MFQTLLILWLALMSSQLLFLVPLFVVPPPPEPPDPMLPMAFGFVAIGVGVAALVVPKALFRKAVIAQRIPMVEAPDPEALPGFNKTVKVPSDPEGAVRSLLQAFQVRTILGCALGEAVSLLGFVLRFLGFGWEVALPYFAVGIALTAVQMPSRSKLVAGIEDVIGVPLRG